MPTWNDDDLTLYYYGEMDARTAARLQVDLVSNRSLANRLAELARLLDAGVPDDAPERDELYGRRVWARVEPHLEAPRPPSLRRLLGVWLDGHPARRPVLATVAVATIAALAFALGRLSLRPDEFNAGNTATALQATTQSPRERLLLQAVSSHLDDTQRLLMLVANTPDAGGAARADERRAASLLSANRLYRVAAQQAGQHQLAEVLEEIEPVLTQLANADAHPTNTEYAAWRHQIRNRDLLFKIRSTDIALQARLGHRPQLSI
jgi:hypothetical protein